MAVLPARVDLNGQVLYPAIQVCDRSCLPFPHYHQRIPPATAKVRGATVQRPGHEDTFCAWCFHWITTDGDIQPRTVSNCGCEQDCHQLGRLLTELA